MYGVIDFSRIDTQPGSCGPFAPPAGWHGDHRQYRQYLQARFDGDIGVRQQVAVVGRILVRPESGTAPRFFGPHAVKAREFALSLWS
ncbi:MAG TPA: hypothetical protein DIT03_11040 [Candidatus Accumulibacter sp.]|nr:hypothetical protein [Accumulibacter sp.]